MTKIDLPEKLSEVLQMLGGSAPIVEICKKFWQQHESELRSSGDLFFTWQYDIRWAATNLRKAKIMKSAEMSPAGIWELSSKT